MILARSPYYIIAEHPNDFVTSVDFNVSIFVEENTVVIPYESYLITKNVTGIPQDKTFIDISPLVRDFFSPSAKQAGGFGDFMSTGDDNGEGLILLVSVDIVIKDSIGSNNGVQTVQKIASNGYTDWEEGINLEFNKKILLSNSEYRVFANDFFIVPISVTEGAVTNPTINGNEMPLFDLSGNSNNRIQYIHIDCKNHTDSVTIDYMGNTVFLDLIEECKYGNTEIQFLNKYGAIEMFQFIKAKKDDEDFTSNEFNNSQLDINGLITKKHQFQKINVQGKGGFEVDSGFLLESSRETVKQLMMSEYCWLKEGAHYRPINVDSKSIDYKTRIVDKLITYNLKFKNAYYSVNNV